MRSKNLNTLSAGIYLCTTNSGKQFGHVSEALENTHTINTETQIHAQRLKDAQSPTVHNSEKMKNNLNVQ